VLAAIVVLTVPGCGKTEASGSSPFSNGGGAEAPVSPFASFRDVPGVTAQEIAEIELLQKEHGSFIFGANLSTEAFRTEDGKIAGYVPLFCEWLTEFFDIRFQPEIYQWNDLLEKLNDRSADFMANLTATEERRKIYFMTDAVAERQLKVMRLRGSPSLDLIAQERLPRYALLRTTNSRNLVASATQPGSYEIVDANDTEDAYRALKSGRADAYIEGDIQVDFYPAADVYTADFFPLLFTRVSLTTANPYLEPVISVVNKALRGGAIRYMNHLSNLGFEAYKKEKFLSQLTADERAYLLNPPPVQLAARYYNYPMDFYNSYEHRWEGIAFDVLAEVEKFTGIKFEVANKENAEVAELLEMLYEGKAQMTFDLPHTPMREERFIWAGYNFLPNQYALLSKTEFPNVSLNEITNAKIGLIANTAHAEIFRRWFPEASNTRVYETVDDGFIALEHGEVDLVMSSKNRLLSLLNYYELSDYKANYLFNHSESAFAFNNDQAVLCSIVDKALSLIDTNTIVEQWMTKTYDYKAKLMEVRLPWFFGAGILITIILILILILFSRALSDKKRLAKVVSEETSALNAILNGTPDHIFCKDLHSRYTRYNNSFRDYYNIRDSAIGRIDSEALGFPSGVAGYHKSMDKKVFTEGETVISEVYVPAPDGRTTLFEVIKSPLLQDGKVTGLVGMARDITRRKAAEDQAKKASAEAMKAYAEAETASEAKSRFIANMSHEMRTPMNVIVGLTDLMLEEENVPEEVKDTLKKINTAGNTLTGLINDVLDISKIESGKQNLNPVQYEVASFLNDIITLNMIRIGEKPVEFKLDIDEEMPRTLFGDDLRVKQILNNLLGNAFKYTERGSVTLGVVASPRDGDNVWVTFSITDTGIGIREEDIKKLFSDYNQVNARANRKIEGTGLGLSITKKFVEMMGGEIAVESEYGKGTTFRARIRQGFVTDTHIAPEIVENLRDFRYTDRKKQTQGKIVRADLSHAKVLVVDDFPMNLDVASGMLRKYKMQVDCVTNGQEAVDRIAAGKPKYNAVFMDHMMPGMDGVEATKLIRALDTGYAKKIPIIALTANAVAGSEQMFLDNGFNAFLPKPFNSVLLDVVINQWVVKK
jgi:PAS domain S-box-containing protein